MLTPTIGMRRRNALRTGSAAVFIAAVVAAAAVSAAPPITDPVEFKALIKKLNGLNFQLGEMRSAGLVPNETLFKDYFAMALQVISAPANTNLPNSRRDYFRKHLSQSGNVDSKVFHDELNKLLLDKLPQLAEDADLKPAAQVNAVMILNDLNSKELATGGGGTAVPLSAALPALLKLFRSGKSDAVRATALAGLLRHAEAGGMSKDMQSQTVAEMLKSLAVIDPPKGRSPDGHLWFRRRAADILGAIGAPGDDSDAAAVAKALAAVLMEKGDSQLMPLRCDAARALGLLKLTASQNLNYSRLVHTVAALAVDAARDREADTQRGFRASIVPVDNLFQGVLVAGKGADPAKRKSTGLLGVSTGTPHEEFVKGAWSKVEPLVSLSLSADFKPEEAVSLAEELETWLSDNPAEGDIVAAN